MSFIPEAHRDLLDEEARLLAYLATAMTDGIPQVMSIWFNTDGSHVLVNSAKGRVKDRNMRARPAVAAAIQDRNVNNLYVQVRGRAVEIFEDRNLDHIGCPSMKYRKRNWIPVQGKIGVVYKILPESVFLDD